MVSWFQVLSLCDWSPNSPVRCCSCHITNNARSLARSGIACGSGLPPSLRNSTGYGIVAVDIRVRRRDGMARFRTSTTSGKSDSNVCFHISWSVLGILASSSFFLSRYLACHGSLARVPNASLYIAGYFCDFHMAFQ